MPEPENDLLMQLSDALAARAEAARGFTVAVRTRRHLRSGILWRSDAVVASEQAFPREREAEIVLPDGRTIAAQVAGRDSGTNVVALRLEGAVAAGLPTVGEPKLGAFAIVFGAEGNGNPTVRLGLVRALGPAWHSLAGGLIDRRIDLDLRLSPRDEGGPVVDAGGALLGMSTAGPRGRGLVIPSVTITRVLEPLLATGRVQRGWLGVAMHPVALPSAIAGETGQERGLMVMRVAADSPAANAGLHAGDILLRVGDVAATRIHEIGRALGPDSVGKVVTLEIVRAGGRLTLAATISARPA
jgi:S1-C subfamily serine protease